MKNVSIQGTLPAFGFRGHSQKYEDGTPLERREQVWKDRQFVQLIIKTIIQSRETITDAKLKSIKEFIQSVPDAIQSLLDDYFTREALDAEPGYILRTLALSRLERGSFDIRHHKRFFEGGSSNIHLWIAPGVGGTLPRSS